MVVPDCWTHKINVQREGRCLNENSANFFSDILHPFLDQIEQFQMNKTDLVVKVHYANTR